MTNAESRDRRAFYAQHADSGSFVSPVYNQVVLQQLYTRLRGQPIHLICDVGSGSGSNLPALRTSFPDASVIPLDLNHAALNHGRLLIPSALPAQADASSLPIRPACVDLVVCTEVLEHVEDLAKAVEEIARIVAPQGHAVISSPNYFNPMGLRKWWEDSRSGKEFWDPWGGHPGFERLMLPHRVDHILSSTFRTSEVRGAGYVMSWIPLGYRRVGALNDKYPLLRLGRLPIFRSIATNRFLLLERK